MNSDTTLVHAVVDQSTPIESVNQRVSLAARIPSRLWTRELLLGQRTWQRSNAAARGKSGGEKGTSLISTVGEAKEPQGHARKSLMQAA